MSAAGGPSLAAAARTGPRAGVAVVADVAEFEALRQPWDELVTAAGAGPFLRHGWLAAWWEAFGGAVRPFVLTLWRDGQLVAGAPLYRAREPVHRLTPWLRTTVVRLLGDQRAGFSGWPVAPGHEDACDALLERLLAEGDWSMAVFEPMRQGPEWERLVAAAARQGLRLRSLATGRSAVADLSAGWEAYMGRRPGKERYQIRAAARRVAERGGRVVTERDCAAAAVERFLEVSARSWKGRAGTGLGASDAGRLFLRRLWERFGPAALRVHLVEIDGTDAVGGVTIVDGDTAYGLAVDFDEAFAALSPGRFLATRAMQDSAREGLVEFDMLRTTDFSERLATEHYSYGALRLFRGANLPYLTMLGVDAARPIGRAWRARRRRLATRRPGYKEAGR